MGKLHFSRILIFLVVLSGVIALTSPLRFTFLTPNDDRYDNVFLLVDGCVMHPLNLSYFDIANLPSVTVEAELTCVDDQLRLFTLKSNWTGVPLYQILSQAGVTTDAIKVAFYAIDGFTTDLTIEDAMDPEILLAYKENGRDIPSFGGGTPYATPFRLVVPGRWGYKWIKWIQHIEIVDYDFLGQYESRGYPDDALVPTSLLYPSSITQIDSNPYI